MTVEILVMVAPVQLHKLPARAAGQELRDRTNSEEQSVPPCSAISVIRTIPSRGRRRSGSHRQRYPPGERISNGEEGIARPGLGMYSYVVNSETSVAGCWLWAGRNWNAEAYARMVLRTLQLP
jgi:hypothetical protein